ncbi:MAG: hypothetical protein JOS17DRAFT_262977 [Linnemannia elongata]|nr:MAG: hypothetical protein JOS17DRAFT_262977 [Linnemannia elongata]
MPITATTPMTLHLFNEKRGTLFLHTKLGLNLKDCSYRQVNLSSRNMFQSRERMTVQCVTNVYSFGKQVINLKETRPAEYFNGRYVYRIAMVDGWLQDYLQTVGEGGREEEMESFLYNLTIVQEFSALPPGATAEEDDDEDDEDDEDEGMERRRGDRLFQDIKRPALLVVAYEFCAGQQGHSMQSQSYRLTSGPPPASVRARSNTWDHPMPSVPWHLSGYSHGGMGGPIKRTSQVAAQREWPPQPKRSRKESFSGFSPYS